MLLLFPKDTIVFDLTHFYRFEKDVTLDAQIIDFDTAIKHATLYNYDFSDNKPFLVPSVFYSAITKFRIRNGDNDDYYSDFEFSVIDIYKYELARCVSEMFQVSDDLANSMSFKALFLLNLNNDLLEAFLRHWSYPSLLIERYPEGLVIDTFDDVLELKDRETYPTIDDMVIEILNNPLDHFNHIETDVLSLEKLLTVGSIFNLNYIGLPEDFMFGLEGVYTKEEMRKIPLVILNLYAICPKDIFVKWLTEYKNTIMKAPKTAIFTLCTALNSGGFGSIHSYFNAANMSLFSSCALQTMVKNKTYNSKVSQIKRIK